MQNQRVHVLVVVYPAQGHINPLVQFAKRLASKGVKATLATTPYTINSIHANSTIAIEPISDGFDEGGFEQAPSVEAYLESFKTFGSTTLADLIVKFNNSGTPVSCIVYDSLLSWALDVAKEFGIYAAIMLTNSASVCSLYYQIHQGRLTLPLKQETVAAPLPGLPSLGFSDFPSFLAHPTTHSAYLALILDKLRALDQNDWVFCNSFEELESELVKALRGVWPVVMIGPMVPSFYLDHQIEGDTSYGASLWKQDNDRCLKWLDSKPLKSVVYVSFGSMASISSKQFEEIAWGLKESNMPFLWVAKEFKDQQLQLEFIDSIGERGLFVTWCNQLEVMAHQAVGCFVTHCGWNSTLEGLSLGVPMVGVPQWSDQPTNAKFVADVWRVGVRAKTDDGIVTREELGKCLREVMVGEIIKSNASKWKEHAKRAVSVGGSSDRNIDEFIAWLLKSKET
ncbi:hypothetical protein PTKIN_Ptkin04bG0082900 [Pterospermum kingtungense]